jgi:hypothetical protein
MVLLCEHLHGFFSRLQVMRGILTPAGDCAGLLALSATFTLFRVVKDSE